MRWLDVVRDLLALLGLGLIVGACYLVDARLAMGVAGAVLIFVAVRWKGVRDGDHRSTP